LRDLPPRRIIRDQHVPASSHTGKGGGRNDSQVVSSPDKRVKGKGPMIAEKDAGKVQSKAQKSGRKHTYMRKPRRAPASKPDSSQLPPGARNRKQGTTQVWLPVRVRPIEESSKSTGKKQRTGSVFDRIEEPTSSVDSAWRGRREQ
jgi:hypothetical protein